MYLSSSRFLFLRLLCGEAGDILFCEMVSREEVELLLKTQREAFKETVDFMVASYREKLDNISTELQEVKAELVSVKQMSESKFRLVDDISNKVADLEVLVEENRFDSKPVFERLDSLEDHSRRNNLRFSGIEELPNENWEQSAELVRKLAKEKLEIPDNLEVERAHRIGTRAANKPRTIIVKFLRFQDRQKILRASSKLKGSNIFVNEDLCEESLKKRKEQLPQLKEARREGKIAYFSHTTLIVRERTFLPSAGRTGLPRNSSATLLPSDSTAESDDLGTTPHTGLGSATVGSSQTGKAATGNNPSERESYALRTASTTGKTSTSAKVTKTKKK